MKAACGNRCDARRLSTAGLSALRGTMQVFNAPAQFGATQGSSLSYAVHRSLFGRCCLQPAEAVLDLRQPRFQSADVVTDGLGDFWVKLPA